MKVSVLASGSKGNCTYIEGSSGALMIDAGRSAREILGTRDKGGRLKEAGGRSDIIEAILVTHEHTDHIRGLLPLGRSLEVPVIGTGGTLGVVAGSLTSKKPVILDSIKHNEKREIGEFTITPFPVSHDATDPCGFFIEENSEKICFCTDTGVVTSHMMDMLKKADGIILESNHCHKMLMNGPYPAFLKRRIASQRGHLSNDDAGKVLNELAGSIHFAILAHLSEENNEPDIAMTSAWQALGFYSDDTELFAASSVDLINKPPIRKQVREDPDVCSDECWKISITL